MAQTKAIAQNDGQAAVDQIMAGVGKPTGSDPISIVREEVLKEAAITLGARQGLRAKSCAVKTEIEARRVELDRKFRFSDLMMGRGVLPPSISEARDSVALDATVMRVASRVYHLDEPARVVDLPPTWRDWLYVGLSTDSCSAPVTIETVPEQVRPRNSAEEAYFRDQVARSYAMGRRQAHDIFSLNLARLERAYLGMRRYFDLYGRGMVSAPVIATSTDVVKRDDPNTLIVGNTVIRITVPVDFVDSPQAWVPLAQ